MRASLVLAVLATLAACGRDAPSLCVADSLALHDSSRLRAPWREVALPARGGTICTDVDGEAAFHNGITIEHVAADAPVATVRDAYLAAFRAGGWSRVNVVDDAAVGFGADLTKPDGSETIALAIELHGDRVVVDAHRAGRDWDLAR